MADEELELDVNEKKGGNKTIIMIVIGILLLNGIGAGAWLFLSDSDSGGDTSNTADKKEVNKGPIIYQSMVPEFIVNFGPGSKVRYLQVNLQVSTRDESSLSILSAYRPVIRNDILVVLSDVSYEDLKDRAGKEALLKKLLNSINKVIVNATNSASEGSKNSENGDSQETDEVVNGPIENVYYTHFIMQ